MSSPTPTPPTLPTAAPAAGAGTAAAQLRPGRAVRLVPRRALVFTRLQLPGLARRQLVDAVRLQLTQYLPSAAFGFVCRSQSGGAVLAWAWPLEADAASPRRGGWAESALDEAADGLRLVRRGDGVEAQQWQAGELRHSRWFAALPDPAQWQQFVRGCGADAQQHPRPEPVAALVARHPGRGWLAGDNLPATRPILGWRAYLALLLAGAALAAALGAHLQARLQLGIDQQRLQALRSGREAALQARTRYEKAALELDALQRLVPRLTQLELLDRVAGSGVFVAAAAARPSQPTPPAVAPGAPAPAPAAVASVRLVDWDVRGEQLRMTLELPERDVALLDITRRLENQAGLTALRVGQDASGNALTLSARIALLAPGEAAVSAAPAAAAR